jgi:hypothetical protein
MEQRSLIDILFGAAGGISGMANEEVTAIKQIFLDLIGPNERIDYHELPSVITRNEFREELRNKVEEL